MGHESAFSRLELLARNFQFRVGRQRSLNLELLINIDIDVNRDGVSDQLLEATLQTQAFIEAETKRWQANASKDSDPLTDPVYKAYQTAATNANLQLEARLPFSNQIKQGLAQMRQIDQEIEKKFGRGPLNSKQEKELELAYVRLRKISGPFQQDPSYLKVTAAQGKVYEAISRRSTAR